MKRIYTSVVEWFFGVDDTSGHLSAPKAKLFADCQLICLADFVSGGLSEYPTREREPIHPK